MEATDTTPATLAFTLKTTTKSFMNGGELNGKKEVIHVHTYFVTNTAMS